LGLNQLDDAENAFNQVLTANPQNTAALFDLAKVYLAHGKNPSTNAKAVDLLNKVMASARGENAGEAAFLLGNYFFNLRDNERDNKKTALAYYLRVALLISGPRGEEAAFRSGQCHKVLGNTEAARSAFQAYLRRFPSGGFIADAQQELAALPASPPQS
jgi:tetratricopeptide (TPR) repeat protein